MKNSGWLIRSLEEADIEAKNIPGWAKNVTQAVEDFYAPKHKQSSDHDHSQSKQIPEGENKS
jgi:hypothetical protein